MHKDQKGMTLIGWVIVLAIVGVFALAGMRLLPVYLEYFKINAVLNGLDKEMEGEKATSKAIYIYVKKRFDVESVNVIDESDLNIEIKGAVYEVRAKYDHRVPFLGNVDFIVAFDTAVEVDR
jgi:Tfp pilus assembly major pilin PilA